ncbi:MAG: hypothetical protein ACR2MZ_01185 [Candidatus Dormibacter sp.]|uniref:hypothetical protein n=1 Tax=Candidatus Dormibacter sp. TaxID=2973982 RepID=UPI0026D321A2
MPDSLDLRIGHGLAQKREFAAASRAVTNGHIQDGAVVLDDPPAIVADFLTVGQIAVLL